MADNNSKINYEEIVNETFLFRKYFNKFVICNSKLNDYLIKVPKILASVNNFSLYNLIQQTFDLIKGLINEINEIFKNEYYSEFIFIRKALMLHNLCIDLEKILNYAMFK
jgi:hypothetical protein